MKYLSTETPAHPSDELPARQVSPKELLSHTQFDNWNKDVITGATGVAWPIATVHPSGCFLLNPTQGDHRLHRCFCLIPLPCLSQRSPYPHTRIGFQGYFCSWFKGRGLVLFPLDQASVAWWPPEDYQGSWYPRFALGYCLILQGLTELLSKDCFIT